MIRNSYQGKTKEQGLNRIDLGFRSFNPTTGIFDRSDPLAEMTPDFSPFSYGMNNTVNIIDEWGLSGSGWNTRGREKTEAETANQEQMDNSTIKRVEITQSPGSMANVPDFGSKGWYKSPEVGQKVMDADNSVFDYAKSIVFGKEYKDNFGFQYNVGFDGKIKGFKPISGNAPDIGIGKATSIIKSFKSFPALRRYLGGAGNGSAWHHIVEKYAKNLEKFGADKIHNVKNIVKLPADIHNKVTKYYNSKHIFTKGKTYREFIQNKSDEYQFKKGLEILGDIYNGKIYPN